MLDTPRELIILAITESGNICPPSRRAGRVCGVTALVNPAPCIRIPPLARPLHAHGMKRVRIGARIELSALDFLCGIARDHELKLHTDREQARIEAIAIAKEREGRAVCGTAL